MEHYVSRGFESLTLRQMIPIPYGPFSNIPIGFILDLSDGYRMYDGENWIRTSHATMEKDYLWCHVLEIERERRIQCTSTEPVQSFCSSPS